jgi:hypothetical protein
MELSKFEKQLNYVKTHLECLTPSEIEGIFKNVYRKTFTDLTGIPVGKHDTVSFIPVKKVDRNKTMTINPYYLNFDLPIYENVNIIEKHLSEFGVSIDEFNEYLLFTYLFTECYFLFNIDKSTIKPYSLRELVQFMYYIETGIILNYDDLKERYGVTFNSSTLNLTIGNLTIKCLKNGNVRFKGLSKKQIEKIQRFNELRQILPRHEY